MIRSIATTVSALVLAGLPIAVGVSTTATTLVVDGQTTQSWGYARTVAEVLANEHLVLAEGDEITPAPSDPVPAGTPITVRHHRTLTLTIDGQESRLETNESTLAAALSQAGLPSYGEARISTPADELLPRGTVQISITTPKPVSLTVSGTTRELTTTAPTVGILVAEAGTQPSGDQGIWPTAETPVTAGIKVAIGKIQQNTVTKREAVPFETASTEDSSLFQGEEKVLVKGSDGEVDRDYTTVQVDGAEFLTFVAGEKIVTPPTTKKVTRGTRLAGVSGKGIDLRREEMWERVAACESSHNWQLQDRQYYGGLQFHTSTWVANGGRDFAPRADLATRAQQITVANRLYDKSGLGPWSCKG